MRDTSSSYDCLFKYILLGDSGVGKSAFIEMYINQNYIDSPGCTIGVDFAAKIINVDGVYVKLQIWDTAGQETFKSIIRSYYREALGVLVFYDVSKLETFMNIPGWIEDMNKHNNGKYKISIIGNKNDLSGKKIVTTDMGKELAKKYNANFHEISVKDNDRLDNVFADITRDIITDLKKNKITKEEVKDSNRIRISTNKIYEDNQIKSRKCCTIL